MNTLKRAGALLLISLLGGCSHAKVLIPDGTYISGAEAVEIRGSQVRFRIKLDEQASSVVVDRSYEYSVLRNGRIHAYGLVSTDVATGIAKFDWYWDGKQITQRDPRRQREKIFRLTTEARQ